MSISEKFGTMEIRIKGMKGNIPLSPSNYDISEIKQLLENIEYLLYPTNTKNHPVISYNIETGEFDRSDLELIELIDYSPKFDKEYISALIEKASPNYENVDPDALLAEIRGYR